PPDNRHRGCIQTYLRFTPQEFRAISQACVSLDFGGDLFSGFKTFLIDSLSPRFPTLATRIAHIPRSHVGIIYEHLKGERASMVQPSQGLQGERDGPELHLSGEDRKIVTRAAEFLWLHDECLPSFKVLLVRLVEERSPVLARRLARLTDHELEALCRQVQG